MLNSFSAAESAMLKEMQKIVDKNGFLISSPVLDLIPLSESIFKRNTYLQHLLKEQRTNR